MFTGPDRPMTHRVRWIAAGGALAGIALAATSLGLAATFAVRSCTAAQKAQRQAAVAADRKKIPIERAVYFKRHDQAKERAAFVKRQQARLAALQAAAHCAVSSPPTASTPSATPAPTPPPATGGFYPSLAKPGFADNSSGVAEPWVGERGPKSDPYFLSGRGHLRTLLVPFESVVPSWLSVTVSRLL